MHPQLTRLEGLDQLSRLIDGSASCPVLLFKHSYSCGISAEALDELATHLDDTHAGTTGVTYAMVTVQTHRDVSNAVAKRLGVRHETPQALLVRDGRVVWSASHFRVTARAVHDAISAAMPAQSLAPRPTPTTTPTES
jgi:bacillithiol system protein YtxJ